jgi:protein-S-isoprenylcysteine O-methyltransferase Ste14
VRDKVIALTYGVICHLAFGVAIVLMAYDVYFGFTRSLWPIGGDHGRLWNTLLVCQFPLIHSLLLSKRGRRILGWCAPGKLGEQLSTTTFAVVSSLQLVAVFLLWTPSETVWFAPTGALKMIMSIFFIGAWVLLVKAISDASIALHTGFLGWSSVFRGRAPRFDAPAERGSYRYLRQPIYLAFALILFTGPVWSPDHLFFFLVWGGYCVLGPRLKERRLSAWYGEEYRRYQRAVPYMIPRFRGLFRRFAGCPIVDETAPAGKQVSKEQGGDGQLLE